MYTQLSLLLPHETMVRSHMPSARAGRNPSRGRRRRNRRRKPSCTSWRVRCTWAKRREVRAAVGAVCVLGAGAAVVAEGGGRIPSHKRTLSLSHAQPPTNATTQHAPDHTRTLGRTRRQKPPHPTHPIKRGGRGDGALFSTHSTGVGGGVIEFGGGCYQEYRILMYPACILKDTRILMYLDVSQTYLTCSFAFKENTCILTFCM